MAYLKILTNILFFYSKDFTGSIIEDHLCGFERIDCDFKCGQKIQRNRLKAHQINTCSKRMISCSYCARDFTADTLQSHHTKCPRFPVPCPFRCGLKSASNGPDGVGKFESLDNNFSNLALSSVNDFQIWPLGICRRSTVDPYRSWL